MSRKLRKYNLLDENHYGLPLPTTKEQAQSLNMKTFFTGVPCGRKHDRHLCERKNTINQPCVGCIQIYQEKRNQELRGIKNSTPKQSNHNYNLIDAPEIISRQEFLQKIIATHDGCWYSPFKDAQNLSMKLFFGDCDYADEIKSSCANELCCRPDHLNLGVHTIPPSKVKRKSITEDRRITPRNIKKNKITKELVLEIIDALSSGHTQCEVAYRFNISYPTVNKIKNRVGRYENFFD